MAQSFRFPAPPDLPPWAAWLVALALPLLAFSLQTALRAWTEPIPFVLFFLVISVAAWISGPGPGLGAVAFAALLGFLFMRGSESAVRAAGAHVGALVFLPVGALIAGLVSLARAAFLERERAVAELRRSQAELSDAVRARDAFLSIASHELKTPLTSMQLVLQTIARQVHGGKMTSARDVAARLPTLERQAQRLALLVGEMLDVSRISGGRLRLAREPVNLGEVVRDVVQRFDQEIQESGSMVTVDADGDVRGRWDPQRVDQVVTNLVSNALKYGTGKPIHVSVRQQTGGAVLEVSDRGIGIEPDQMWKVFERFERTDAALHYGGLGLGLWIAREIVAAHGGSIEVRSNPGAGSTFTVRLPVHDRDVAAEPQSGRA
jgi:signal transduction histidine kinase